MKRKLLSVILSFSMVVCLVPGMPLYAMAASDSDIGNMNALDAIGIDTSKAPDGYDPDSKSNPYGRDTVTLNPVGEFYTVGLDVKTHEVSTTGTAGSQTEEQNANLKGMVYGEGVLSEESTESIMTSGQESVAGSGTYKINTEYVGSSIVESENPTLQSVSVSNVSENLAVLTDVAAGNFDGNDKGLEAQVAMVYTSELDKNGGLYLKVGDAATGKYGEPVTLISKSSDIGNPYAVTQDEEGKDVYIEDFNASPYLMQNYLQVTTGDYDNDGKSEIAVYIPEYGKSRIQVYKLKTTSGLNDYKKPSQWEVAWTYSLKETTYVSNMVSLTSGDFNQDGVDDLGATWGYYYGPDDNKPSTAVVLFGSSGDGKMLQSSSQFDLTYGASDSIVRGAFTFGDITGGGTDALILGGQLASDISKKNLNSRFIAIYSWNGKSFTQTQAQNYDLFSKDDDGDLVYGCMSRSKDAATDSEIFYSSPLCVTNLDVIGQGLGKNACVYLDSLVLVYGDNGLELTAALDNTAKMQTDTTNPVRYVEYNAESTDLQGLGKETLMSMQQTFSEVSTKQVESTITGSKQVTYAKRVWYYKNWLCALFNIRTWKTVQVTETVSDNTKVTDNMITYVAGKAYQVVLGLESNSSGSSASLDAKYSSRTETDYSQSLCVANTDNDTTYMNYDGKYFQYSDPQILAVLASPPYFKDLLGRDDLSGNYAESTTSYSKSSSQEAGNTQTSTISAGAYVSFEQDFKVFGITVASMESEVCITGNFTWDYEVTSTLEQTVTYSASAGQDTVVFYSLPLEIYKFQAFVPDGSGGYTQQLSTVTIPHEANIQKLSLDDYESIAADYDALPQISGKILTHTLGEPASYPNSTAGYSVIAKYEDTPQAVGYSAAAGGASTTEEIVMSTSSHSAFTATCAIDTKVGGGAGGVTVGVTVGTETGAGSVTISTSGSSFSGEMQAMPLEAQKYGYGHNWRIFCYRGSANNGDSTVSFPVVSYIVTDVTAPSSLPEDFQQDVSKTTDDSITLTWSYDKAVAGFQLYRYYKFPDSTGSYELKFVPMTDGAYSEKDGKYHFEFTDTGLSPYEEYSYQIQTVRAAVPNNSILSETLKAMTKTEKGYPEIVLTGENISEDNVLPIYPDSKATVTAEVVNIDDYTVAGVKNVSYQWQILQNGNWSKMAGQDSDTLVFESSGAADQAQYRCVVNAIYHDSTGGNTYYISAYSDVLSTEYSKRTAAIAVDGNNTSEFTAKAEDGKLNISLSLISAHAGHLTAPAGYVTFMVNGPDYSASVGAELVAAGTTMDNKAKNTATASLSNLPDGIYEVTALYNGNRVFKSLSVNDARTVLIGASEAYQLNLSKAGTDSKLTSFEYGDMIQPVLYSVTSNNFSGGSVELSKVENAVFEIHTRDGKMVQSLKEESGVWQTPDVGDYTFVGSVGDAIVASRNFTVSKKNVSISMQDKTSGAGTEYTPVYILPEGSSLAYEEDLASLKLSYVALNSAGNIVALDATTLPGKYTVTPVLTEDSVVGNYEISFISAEYIATAKYYDVKYEALAIGDSLKAGTLELSNASDGSSQFPASTELLFYANPYSGYQTDLWTVYAYDESEGKWNEVSSQSGGTRLHYTMKSEAIRVTVSFRTQDITLTTGVEGPSGSGSIELPEFFTSGGKVTAGAEFTFQALASEGYHFVKWAKITGDVTTELKGTYDEESGKNILNFEMPSASTRLYAYFERDLYQLTLGENLEATYMYDDDGMSSTPEVEKVILSGEKVTGDTEITVRPVTGYSVAEDAEWMRDGAAATAEADNQSCKFRITADTTVSVPTERGSYSLTYSGDNGSVSVTVDGMENPDYNAVPGGSKITATAKADYGYTFDYWLINEKRSEESSTSLTIGALGGSTHIEAVFRQLNSYNVSILINEGIEHASIGYTVVSSLGDTVIEDEPADSGTQISLYEGDSVTVRVTPDSGFMVGKWLINDEVYDTKQKSYTVENISAFTSVAVDIVSQMNYIVKFDENNMSATSDGKAFNSGDEVGGGTTVVFTPKFDSSTMMVKKWTIDGETVLNKYGKPLVSETYVVDGLSGFIGAEGQEGVGLEAEQISAFDVIVDVNADMAESTFSFDPVLKVSEYAGKVRRGAAAVFTFKAKEGYRLDESDFAGFGFDLIDYAKDTNTYTCTIYEISSTPEISITPHKLYTISLPTVSGGTVTASAGTAAEGEKITLSAEAASGYKLNTLTASYVIQGVGGAEDVIAEIPLSDDNSFDMPAGDVTVNVSFSRTGSSGGSGGSSSGGGGSGSGGSSGGSSGSGGGGSGSTVVDKPEVSEPDKDNIPSEETPAQTDPKPSQVVLPFAEISQTDWYYNAVKTVYEKGLMSGTSTTEFSPNDTTTRNMVVTILYRYAGSPAVIGTSGFEDVESGTWYSDAVLWAQQNGVASGISDTLFAPTNLVTREQLAAFLHNYAKLEGYDISHKDSLQGYTDAPSGWSRDAMMWAVGSGIMNGKGNGILDPSGHATRAELATMVVNFVNVFESKDIDNTDDGDIKADI